MVGIDAFRNGMALLSGSVNVITTNGPQGFAGITATAVCSVTDQPPTLLTCINRSSYAYPIFSGNGVLCVNVLSAEQQAVAGVFSDRNITMQDRLSRIASSVLATGSPLIDGALVSFDCRIVLRQEAGSHGIFLCEVENVRQAESGAGLVYFRRNYHTVSDSAEARQP